jgi:hypothetical protein
VHKPAAGWFPILPWSPLHGWAPPYVHPQQGLAGIADCHFNVAGFVWPEDLPECERLGLQAIVAPSRRPRYMGQEWSALAGAPDAALDRRVREIVAAGSHETVLGYFVMDEPGATLFPTLGKVVAAFRRHAPDKLAYINLYPNYATIGAPDESQLQVPTYREYLERFVAEVNPQFLSYDNYTVLTSDDLRDRVRAARYFTNLLEVRAVALEHGLPWWQIVASNQIRPFTPIPSPANLLLQAWTTLAAGARSVGWFTYYALAYRHAPIDPSDRKTLTWFYLQMVNRQLRAIGPVMAQLTSTGVFFTPPAPDESLPCLPGNYVTSVEASVPAMVGEFAGEFGLAYAVLVNLSQERSAIFSLVVRPGSGVDAAASVDDGQFDPIDVTNGIRLAAGQGVLLRLRRPDREGG